MTSEFDQIVENHFKERRDIFGFESVAQLIEEVMDAQTLEEAKDSVQKRAQEFLLVLPKFTPTEAWGDPNSMERQQINRLFGVMGGGLDIKGKFAFLERIANPQNKITSPRRIISSLIILESLSAVINSFNAASAGFVFEGFLSALLQGEQEAEISAMGNLPIQDLIAFKESDNPVPVSLKLLGPKTNIEGSYTNLVDGLDEFGQMIYIVARKTGEAINIEQFRFTQENFLDALYLDAKGRGKASGASLITLANLGLGPEESLQKLKSTKTWPERYELLQQTAGYSSIVRDKKARLQRAKEAEEAKDAAPTDTVADTASVEAAKEALHEAVRTEWTLLNEEGAKQHTQWSISVAQLLSFDFVEYQTLGTLPYSAQQIMSVATLHMEKLNGDLFTLFGATKELSENINKYFTFDKRASAIGAGERAIENTTQIEQALTKGITATAAEPETPEN